MVGQLFVALTVGLVGHADPDRLQLVEDVQLGDGQLGQRVDPDGVAEHDGIQPARAPTTPGGGPVLMADVHEVVAHLVEQLGGERPCSHTRHVGLGDAYDPVDIPGTDAGTGAGAAGNRVGRRHERIGAVVQVQEGRLGALHEDPASGVQLVVDQADGVGDVGDEPRRAGTQVLLGHLVGIDRESVEHACEHLVGVFKGGTELLSEDLLVEEVLDPDAHPHGPVCIGRPDAPLGGPKPVLAQVAFVERVQFLVVREDQVGVAAHPEPVGCHAPDLEHVHLGEEDAWVDDHAVADDRRDGGVEDATGYKVEGERFAVYDDPVAGVVAALVADDHRHLAGHEVGKPALALVTPLRPDDDGRGHGTSPGSGPLRAEPIGRNGRP